MTVFCRAGADFLSLLRSPVRATLPPPATGGNLTHSLLQMLGQPTADLTAAGRQPQPAVQRHPAAAAAPSPGQQGRSATSHGGRQHGQPGRAAQNGGQAPGGRHAGFVPMQVTKKTTPKKPEAGPAGGGGSRRRREAAGGTPSPSPPDADGTDSAPATATDRAQGGETSAATQGTADDGQGPQTAAAPQSDRQLNKPAGRGRLFRRPPKNRLACKF